MRRFQSIVTAGVFAVVLAAGAPRAGAQNLLTNNPGFESNVIYIGPGGSTDLAGIPGFTITRQGNFAGTANDQPGTTGRVGNNFGYLSNGTLMTAQSSRPSVTPGTPYNLSFLLKNDTDTAAAAATVRLAFFDPNGVVPLTGSVEQTFTLAPKAQTSAFSSHSLSGVAPANAAFAAVIIETPSTYIFDNFVLTAVPEPGSLGLLSVGGLALLARRRRRRA